MRYRIFTWADITACIIVIALLLFVFIYPYCLSRDYYELFYDKQQRVLECTREENWGEAQKLMDVTKQSFFEGIKMAKEGQHLHDISRAIEEYVTPYGYGIVRDLVGHGIGTALHEDPQIPNYAQKRRGVRLQAGMTLAIEPMINAGTWQVRFLRDGWTVVTKDGSLSAHYENTILVTDGEPEILTLY